MVVVVIIVVASCYQCIGNSRRAGLGQRSCELRLRGWASGLLPLNEGRGFTSDLGQPELLVAVRRNPDLLDTRRQWWRRWRRRQWRWCPAALLRRARIGRRRRRWCRRAGLRRRARIGRRRRRWCRAGLWRRVRGGGSRVRRRRRWGCTSSWGCTEGWAQLRWWHHLVAVDPCVQVGQLQQRDPFVGFESGRAEELQVQSSQLCELHNLN